MEYQILIAPGYGNSGKGHWQTYWEEKNKDFVRIVQNDWFRPDADDWAETIEKFVLKSGKEVVVVAHSLACLALAHWAKKTSLSIRGALLVAPPNAHIDKLKSVVSGFTPIPLQRLPFKSVVVASSDDEYNSIDIALNFAEKWGSEFVNVGNKGHINANSGIGDWKEGQFYLKSLLESIRQEKEKSLPDLV